MLRGVFRTTQFSFVILLFGAIAMGQSTPPPAASASQSDNRVLAELDKLTHAKRVKSGDTVTARLIAPAKLPDGTELPKGSKLIGTITDIKAKPDKEGPSKMGLLFTGAVPKNGKEIPVRLVLVAVAPHNQQNDVDQLAAGNPFSGGNRMQAGTGANTLNSTSNEGEALSRGLGARAPASRSSVTEDELVPGRSYLPDVIMLSYSAAMPGTILESKNGSTYLDSGTRLLFLVQ